MNTILSNSGNDTKKTHELLTFDSADDESPPFLYLSINGKALLFFLAYLILGVAFYCYGDSQLSALDAIYYSVITFTTVGYGDVTPAPADRLFSSVFVLLGAGIVGGLFGIFSGDVMEYQEEAMKKRVSRAAVKMKEIASKASKKIQAFVTSQSSKKEVDDDEHSFSGRGRSLLRMASNASHSFSKQLSRVFTEKVNQDSIAKMKSMNLAIYEDELRELRSKGLVAMFFVLLSIFSGAVIMMFIEGWFFLDSLYWACVTITTVGYGDVSPSTDGGKVFCIFYTIIGCTFAATGFRSLVFYPVVLKQKQKEMKITAQFGDELSEATLSSILHSDFFHRIPNLRKDSKEIIKSEFVILLLNLMGKVDDKDILLASKIFDKLDRECDGVLSEADQKEEILRARERDALRKKDNELNRVERARGSTISSNLSDTVTGTFSKIASTFRQIIVRGESSELADDQDEDQDIEKAVSVESAYTHNPLVFDEQDDDLIRDQGTGPSTASTAPRRVKEPKDTNAGFGFVYSPLVAGLGYNDEIPGKATASSPQFPDSEDRMAAENDGSVKSVRWGRNIVYSPPGNLTSRKKLSDDSVGSASNSSDGRPDPELMSDSQIRIGASSGISYSLPSSASTASFDTSDEFS